MDQTTHELRLADWQTIVTNCLARPAGQSKKQWLAEHDVPEKAYYYWQRKIRRKTYGELHSGCTDINSDITSGAYEFAEMSFLPESTSSGAPVPAAIIRKGSIIVELNNSIDDRLLGRILEMVSHA